ncbi:unnamed protein product [Macrosiphum euphorbiae]|uniref:Uncharacterized protein n=1 Tax=Macrosiphum euphorbiae TaxID=13131 RepID=A0AAV0VT67_9HEMI|nr:unnamed protein product [Macrosiphum euphorbiae]
MTVQEFEKSYIATKKAYDEVINYENQPSYQKLITNTQPKEDAINDYLKNQMPEISEEKFPSAYCEEHNIRYMYKNYEVYADPTDEVYYSK